MKQSAAHESPLSWDWKYVSQSPCMPTSPTTPMSSRTRPQLSGLATGEENAPSVLCPGLAGTLGSSRRNKTSLQHGREHSLFSLPHTRSKHAQATEKRRHKQKPLARHFSPPMPPPRPEGRATLGGKKTIPPSLLLLECDDHASFFHFPFTVLCFPDHLLTDEEKSLRPFPSALDLSIA